MMVDFLNNRATYRDRRPHGNFLPPVWTGAR